MRFGFLFPIRDLLLQFFWNLYFLINNILSEKIFCHKTFSIRRKVEFCVLSQIIDPFFDFFST